MSVYENSNNPYGNRKKSISEFFEKAAVYVGDNQKDIVLKKVCEIIKTGVKAEDAEHVACAIMGEADMFLTTDKRLLKFKTDEIRMMNPLDFVKELEELL